jgi:hypothetical protein
MEDFKFCYFFKILLAFQKTFADYADLNAFSHDANNPPKSSLENGGLLILLFF